MGRTPMPRFSLPDDDIRRSASSMPNVCNLPSRRQQIAACLRLKTNTLAGLTRFLFAQNRQVNL